MLVPARSKPAEYVVTASAGASETPRASNARIPVKAARKLNRLRCMDYDLPLKESHDSVRALTDILCLDPEKCDGLWGPCLLETTLTLNLVLRRRKNAPTGPRKITWMKSLLGLGVLKSYNSGYRGQTRRIREKEILHIGDIELLLLLNIHHILFIFRESGRLRFNQGN